MTRQQFDHLVPQLSRRLFGSAFRILRNQEEAEDVVQEIFIRMWKMGDKLDEYNSIEALATTMTKNYCIDLIRKHKNQHGSDFNIEQYTGASAPSPQDQLENRESGEILDKIISDLPEAYRTVLEQREINGSSFEEIAEKTGQNINTLRVTLSRARKMVRDEYNRYQYERRSFEKAARKVL
jgi:RNA polymerase sigma factor (sigma-70 family)